MMAADPQGGMGKASRGAMIRLWVAFIALATLVQLLFKRAGEDLELAVDAAGFASAALHSPWVWASIACYIAVFLFWMVILQHMDLGRAFPMTGLTYMTVPLAATVLFHETLDFTRIAGIGIILAGVFVLGSETS